MIITKHSVASADGFGKKTLPHLGLTKHPDCCHKNAPAQIFHIKFRLIGNPERKPKMIVMIPANNKKEQ